MVGAMVEGGVVGKINPAGRSAVLLVCEHASNFVPVVFDNLGLSDALLHSHIAWDPGALAVAKVLSATLDAPLIAQRVSRLVYDCNRPPQVVSAVPAISELHPIPGNSGLSAVERYARVESVYQPFQQAVGVVLDDRLDAGQKPVLVTVHSFTPFYKGARRDVELGILYDSDARLAEALLRAVNNGPEIDARLNQTYGPADGVTHTLAEQALLRGLLNVMIEIRNDLIGDAAGQESVGTWLADCLRQALSDLGAVTQDPRQERSAGA